MKVPFVNRNDDFFTSREFTTGLLTGAVLGIATGILLSSRLGKDTQKRVVDAISGVANDAVDQWGKTKAKAKQVASTVEDKVETAADHVKDRLDDYSDKATDTAKHLADKAEDKADDLSDSANSVIHKVKDVFRRV